MEFVWFILIGLAAGWLAGQLMKGGGFGVIGDIIVGVIGALLGGFLFRTLGVSAGGGLLGCLDRRHDRCCRPAVLVAPDQESLSLVGAQPARRRSRARLLDRGLRRLAGGATARVLRAAAPAPDRIDFSPFSLAWN